MAPKTPSTTTQISEVKLPAWVEKASESNYELAKQIADKPLVQYQGAQVADTSNMTSQAYGLLSKNIGSNDAFYKEAADALAASKGLIGESVGANDALYNKATGLVDKSTGVLAGIPGATGDLYSKAESALDRAAGPLDIERFLNPYIDEVENKALSSLDRSREMALMSNSDKAAAANAFGGSRHGVVDAITNSESIRDAGDLSARLRAAGFDTATSTALAEQAGLRDTAAGYTSTAGNMTQGMLGQAAGFRDGAGNLLDQAGTRTSEVLGQAGGLRDTASGILDTAGSRQDSMMKDFSSLLTAGGMEQAQRQRLIDADMGKFNEAKNYDLEGLNTRLSALGMSPYGKSENTTKTTQGGSSGTDWASTGLGIMSLLFGLSDRDEKTDINKVGDDPKTGIPLYSYRYKGDPKSYPKIVGPMAQDVQKKFPSHVREVGGKKMVNLALLEEIARG